jgi:hypothetical protein
MAHFDANAGPRDIARPPIGSIDRFHLVLPGLRQGAHGDLREIGRSKQRRKRKNLWSRP